MTTRRSLWVLLLAFALAWMSPRASEAAPPSGELPPELKDWVEWVKKAEPEPRDCREHGEVTICVWPSYLTLDAGPNGARFTLDVSVFGPAEVQLPGDEEQWPQEVKVDKRSSPVLRAGAIPRIELEEGRHTVTGFIPWRSMPDSLRIPQTLGLLNLSVGGKSVPFPSRSGETIALEAPVDPDADPDTPEDPDVEPPPEDDTPETVAPDSESIEISRRLVDGVPLEVTTRIRIHITGKARELVLPKPTLAGAHLLQISSPVPLKQGEDGKLILQVQPGTFDLDLTSALAEAPTKLSPPEHPAPWPEDEIWVWNAASEGSPSVGQVSLSGAAAVEHGRTHAPSEWSGGATYRVEAKASLDFEVISRGISQTTENHLGLAREMRADVSGTGWSVVDSISGQMNHGNRINLLQGQGALGSVAVNGKPQVITVADDGHAGVELRGPEVNMRATWRLEDSKRTIPLGAWSEDFDAVELDFMLPRGWDLLHAKGPGSLGPTWTGAWRPLDLILLLGVFLLVARIVHPAAGVAALIGLGLAYTRNGDGYVTLLTLVAALTVLTLPLRKRHARPIAIGLRVVWCLGAFVAATWVIWRVPAGVAAVWRDGLSALAHVRLEGELEELSELGVQLTALAGGVVLLAAMNSRARPGPTRIAALVVTALAGLGAVGMFMESADESAAVNMDSGGDGVDYARVGADQDMMAAAPEREVVEEEAIDMPAPGSMAKPSSKSKSGLYAMKGPADAVPQMARNFEGNADEDVWGGLSGSEVGEAYGVGGLGLAGTGRGGGGTGEGTIGLGNTGLIGKGGGGGTGSGYGQGSGAGFGGRGKRVPQVRQAKPQVKGALDSDIIRRIVRAHINEVRACYNTGLSSDPNLSGRISINFVITGTGKVGSAVVQESTLADRTVGNCVAKAFKRWTFPKPEGGGNVIVTYPLTFSSDGGDSGGDGGAATPSAPPDEPFVAKDVVIPELEAPAIPQTGEGVPDWSGPQWRMRLDRSVKSDESLSLWLVSPTVSRALAILRALALMFAMALILRAGWLAAPEPEDEDEDGDDAGAGERAASPPRERGNPSRSAAGVISTAFLAFFVARPAAAAPPGELLDELGQRVNAERPLAPSPDCADACTLVNRLDVAIAGDALTLTADVHMAGPGVWEIPGSVNTWIPRSVRVDGKPAPALAVHDDELLIHLSEGRHQVELRGPIEDEVLDLDLEDAARHVVVDAKGWRVDGVDDKDLARSLHFERLLGDEPEPDEDPEASGQPDPDPDETSPARRTEDMPPWFAVQRQLSIGARWTVNTTVTRLSHGPSPTKLRVPLLPGEKMLEATRKVDDPKATVTLRHAGDSITWSSILEESAALELKSAADANWTETWVVSCDGAWQCGDEGLPATSDSGGVRVFHPWPGESLQLVFFEPSPAEGQLLAVDSAELRAELSETGTEVKLDMQVRTATVKERTLTLPSGAHVGTVTIDGTPVPVAKDSSEVRLTFQPGMHQVLVTFKLDATAASVVDAPVVQLGGRAVNAKVTLVFADRSERVIVWTAGDGTGPIVWLWPYLALLALLAGGLARYAKPPLNVLQWFLLSLGFSVLALPVVWLWFFAIEWREREASRLTTALRFNAAQLALGIVTLMTLGIVLFTAKELLTAPTATIVHNWTEGEQLSWYVDRVEAATPAATVVTVSTSLWRALWAGWVIWLAYSCLGWGKWSWAVLSAEGWLRHAPAVVVETGEADEVAPAGEDRGVGESVATEGAEETEAPDEESE